MSSPRSDARGAYLSLVLCFVAGSALAAESLPELVERGQRDAALRALEDGAEADARGPDGATALLWAAHEGDRELVAALLARRQPFDQRRERPACRNGVRQARDLALDAPKLVPHPFVVTSALPSQAVQTPAWSGSWVCDRLV